MNLLKGKKTYLTAAAAIIFALVLFFLGQLGGVLTALFILGVAIAVFLRQGINDLAKKIEQETKKELDILNYNSLEKYFARFTQALVSAFTSLTQEGKLYNVDMRLRPSGRKGPVATSISSFLN